MTEMIERVAEALAEQGGMARAVPGSRPILPTMPSDARDRLLDMARAAIAAMREPTEAMLGQMSRWAPCDDIELRAAWDGAIDAALSKEKQSA